MHIQDCELLILDGACGTNLQTMTIPQNAWDDKEGCNEYLNLTYPEGIVDLHKSFLEAGSHMVETNTFGGTRIVLAEYGLEDRVKEINTRAVANAKQAVQECGGGWVAGSVGPGTKLPSLGHIGWEDLSAAFVEQIEALVEAGVDAIIIETSQDIMQTKAALMAAFEILNRGAGDIPVMVSLTIETTGTMLAGSDIAAAMAIVAPFPVFSLGLNCATGPEDMRSSIQYLSRYWDRRISCYPNQGLPEIREGRTCYPMSPENYARQMREFVEQYGVSIAGGCCGTTTEHIRHLVKALQGVRPAVRETAA